MTLLSAQLGARVLTRMGRLAAPSRGTRPLPIPRTACLAAATAGQRKKKNRIDNRQLTVVHGPKALEASGGAGDDNAATLRLLSHVEDGEGS